MESPISQLSSIFGQIRPFTAELAALECLKKSIFFVVATLAPSFLIGSSSYFGVTRIVITSRMSLDFSQIRPLTAELSALDCVKKTIFSVVSTLAPSIVIGSSSFLQVTRITTISQMNSNFGQIRPLTAELAALERL